jgi:ribosome-binding factor A
MTARAQRVAGTVQQALGELLARGAVKDPAVSDAGLISVTGVDVSPDLSHARVWVSIYAAPEVRGAALAALEHAAGFLRRQVGERMRSKRIPRLSFSLDDSLAEGARMDRVLRDLQENKDDE